MFTLPAVTPLTTPVAAFTVATDKLLLVHVPPVTASLNVVVLPAQTVALPDIAAGVLFTVIAVVAAHPPVMV